MNRAFNQHKQGCLANVSCLVVHSDGVCPGPYGICTCDKIVEKPVESIKADITGQATMTKKQDWEEEFKNAALSAGEVKEDSQVILLESVLFLVDMLILKNRKELLEGILAEIPDEIEITQEDIENGWETYYQGQNNLVKLLKASLRTKFGGENTAIIPSSKCSLCGRQEDNHNMRHKFKV